MLASDQVRSYDRANSVVFLKTKEAFGGLSNMAGGFPLKVNGIRILTSEALYQACRFPHLPEVQRLIIEQRSPMTAKMKGKPHRSNSRPDWDQVKVKIMRWCLRAKLAQNWAKFSKLLLETGERPIIEESRRDDFWGAKQIDEQTLVGMNVLGRLLMELREEVKSRDRASLLRVEPLGISDFCFYGQQIQPVEADGIADRPEAAPRLEQPAPPSALQAKPVQTPLFDQPPLNAKTEPRRQEVRQAAGSLDDLKPYPAMKDSGVPWLGEVPEHWDLRRLKTHARNVVEQTSHRGDDDIYVALEHVESWTGRLRPAGPDVKFDSQVKRFQAGDVLFGKLRPYLAKVARPKSSGVCVGEFLVLRSSGSGLRTHYLELLLRSRPIIDAINSSTFGAKMPRADWQFVGNMRLPLPPVPEQSSIVRFLDHMDRRIWRAIRAKQKLIALLNEQKQAIIHQAVTRGPDPNVRLKPSGVEWLGDVPEHWEVSRVKHLSKILRGKFTHRPRNDPSLYDGPYPFIQTGEVARATKTITTYRQTLNERGLAVSKMFPAGTLVMTIAANIGDVAILDFEACFPDSVVGFVPRAEVERDYLYYLFRAMKSELLQEAPVNTQGNLNIDRIGSRVVAIPPVHEQQEIVVHVERSTAGLNDTIDRAHREISLFREYRTRLIADVVTGKLDVREVAARLPTEAEEPELLDEADVLEGGDEEAGEADLDEASEEAVA